MENAAERIMKFEPPSWLGSPPDIPEGDIAEEVTVDIIIAGGGHSGLNTARAAAECGASVAVIEEQRREKMSWFGEQIGHFNSRYLIDRGFGPYDTGEIVNEFVTRAAGRVNPTLVSLYVNKSGEMFDSLISLIPEDDDMLSTMNIQESGFGSYPTVVGGNKTWAGCAQFRAAILSEAVRGGLPGQYSNINRLNGYALADSEKNGAAWYFYHRAAAPILSGSRVTGLLAKNLETGKFIKFNARRSVVLACGDFGGNAEMCVDLLSELADYARARKQPARRARGMGRRGDGHRIGLWAGGHMEPAPRAAIFPGEFAGPFGNVSFLCLNEKGLRFANEANTSTLPPLLMRQPLGKICTVTDNKWLEHAKRAGVQHGNPDFGRPEYIEQAAEDMEKAAKAGPEGYPVRSLGLTERVLFTVYGAETLDELADYLGYTGDGKRAFLDSVEHYNRLCYDCRDPDFGKEKAVLFPVDSPPYFGMKSGNENLFWGLCTLAGLETDITMNVLGDDLEPIEGLYAVGNCLGGRYANGYNTPVGGNSIGMAMTHGRVLGKYLARSCHGALTDTP